MQQVDPKRIALIATALIWAWLVADALLALNAAGMIDALGGFGDPRATDGSVPVLQLSGAVLGLLYTLVYIGCAVAVLRWIFVTNRNAQTWSTHVSITPGWNVGWFFVPFANLVKPFEGVRETYQATLDPVAPARVPVPIAMRLWWAAWLLAGILSGIALQLSIRATTIDQIIAANWIMIGALPVDLAAVALLTLVIRATTRAQRQRLASAAPLAPAGANP